MTCNKCGAELEGEYTICPKCGNKLKKKSKAGLIFGIILLLLLIGVGSTLYISGFYKDIAVKAGWTAKENETVLTDNSAGNLDSGQMEIENQQEVNTESKAEEPEMAKETAEDPDEQELFLEGLSFEPVTMTMGETCQVELEREIPDGTWISSDEKVVKAADGQLQAGMPGKAIVTFGAGAKEIPFEVTVNAFSNMTLAVNYSRTMELNDIFSNVRWESSAPEIVSVEEGVISSLQAGSSTVTAYIDEVPYSFEVVATTPDITTTSVRKIIGNTEQVSILGTNGKAEWKSDNTAIATVSDTGLITAEPTGAGQSTVVHAFVDEMEFKIDVAVEPIPQLSSTYKIYGHQDNSTYKNAKITICTNANETATVTYPPENKHTYLRFGDGTTGDGYESEVIIANVLNVADADYSGGMIFPLYHVFRDGIIDGANYTDIYLVGTSQTADVLIQSIFTKKADADGIGLRKSRSVVTYEPCENYGIIHIYSDDGCDELVTVTVDGYQYQFIISALDSMGGRFDYGQIDRLSADYMVEECSVDEIVVPEKVNVNYSTLQANSRTYNPDNEWLERIGTKFVESVEDQAIEMAAGALLKFIFL